jgi:hypothetical protein
MGDGTVLSRLMRLAHSVHPAVPMVAVAKEISLEDVRLESIVHSGAYLKATQKVLHKLGGLWFNDEAFVVSRNC